MLTFLPFQKKDSIDVLVSITDGQSKVAPSARDTGETTLIPSLAVILTDILIFFPGGGKSHDICDGRQRRETRIPKHASNHRRPGGRWARRQRAQTVSLG